MLFKCESVLLLSDVESFCDSVKNIAGRLGVKINVQSDWSRMYRVKEEIIMCGSKYIDKINEAFLNSVTVILKHDESPLPFLRMGIDRFIFDYQNEREIMIAMYKKDEDIVMSNSIDYALVLAKATSRQFVYKDYDFRFDTGYFTYKGEHIYFTDFQKCYLAKWLLLGIKDNSKRTHLYIMRRKFGKDFLKDVDRFGQVKEENDEQ